LELLVVEVVPEVVVALDDVDGLLDDLTDQDDDRNGDGDEGDEHANELEVLHGGKSFQWWFHYNPCRICEATSSSE
jgi:hypothetical protein